MTTGPWVGLLVAGLLVASGWAAAEHSAQENAGTTPVRVLDPAKSAQPEPARPAEPERAYADAPAEPAEPYDRASDDGADEERRMKEELRQAAKQLRGTLLGEFKAWKSEQRTQWQAEKAALQDAYRAEVREIKVWWQAQVAEWRTRCASSTHQDPAPAPGNNTTAPPPGNSTGNSTTDQGLASHSLTVEASVSTGSGSAGAKTTAAKATPSPGSDCGRARAALNHQAHERLAMAREDAREQKRALDLTFRERMEDQFEDLADRMREALEDRMLDLRASFALDVGAAMERGLRQAAGKAREHQARCAADATLQGCAVHHDGPRCDANMRCKPPLACEGKVGTSAACTPPAVCKDLRDGTWQCPTPEQMVSSVKTALSPEMLAKMRTPWGAQDRSEEASS